MRGRAARTAFVALVAACAQPSPPPGGPPDIAPPVLVGVSPDSGAVNARPREVVFRFDEVVSERPQGAPDLAGLFLISPREGDTRVRWHRSSITVRPQRGWRANTVYTITMLPGLMDLRGNVSKRGATIAFSTGPDFPPTRIAGIVFDWVAQRPAARASVEAIAPDSTTYVAATDSTGAFTITALRPGPYAVRAVIDANGNRRRDPREPWDSTRVELRDTLRLELLAIVHDTIGPRLGAITLRDSLTLRLALDQPLSPTDSVGTDRVRITRADSTRVAVTGVFTTAEFERLERDAARARADSARRADTTRRAVDTTARPPAADTLARPDSATARQARPSRPAPPMELVVRLGAPLAPGTVYRVRLENLRGLISRPRSSERVFSTPKLVVRDTTAAGRAKAARDSAGTPRPGRPNPRDSTARRP